MADTQRTNATRAPRAPFGQLGLRSRLIVADVVGFAIAATFAELAIGWSTTGALSTWGPVRIICAVLLGVTFARWQGLYVAARCVIRSAEFTGIVRTAILLGAASLVIDEFADAGSGLARAATLTLVSIGSVTLSRSLFRTWLRAMRSGGRYTRPILLVGANKDAARIASMLEDHPETGFDVVGVCGDVDESLDNGLRALWRGDHGIASSIVQSGEATGAIVVANALGSEDLNDVVRDITDSGGHVHLSSGLRGIATGRIEQQPIAHEPLMHINPRSLDRRQLVMKRAVDVVTSSALLVLTGPIVLVSYLVVRLSDGGPGLFRQVRIGRDGREFEVLKLRTMVVGAEDQVTALAGENERNGPLFKLERDPRVTPIGGLLRALSIDELPQLWNVLRGEMSMVGPRPALPEEVQAFPPDLHSRTTVLPGITGLWQVEARDNPSFDAYRRLDRFYVDNWTVTFDLIILLATVESEVARILTRVFRGGSMTSRARLDIPATHRELEISLADEALGSRSTLVD